MPEADGAAPGTSARRTCLALAGPTAAGKTAAALALAQHLAPTHHVEIISVDSALVYRGMDIGTAKPSATELAAVPHHLIDIRDPLQPYSAAEFVDDATELINAIHARGGLPLLVGGTMLYFKALFDGIDAMPRADATVRAAIDAQARTEGWPAVHAELTRVDPVTAARLAPADSQRIQRALEVYRISGQPISAFHGRKDAPDSIAKHQESAWTWSLFSLEPSDRAWLHARIAARFDAMLAGGFVEEVRALRARGDLSADLPSMRCVGYRQAWEMLDAHQARGLDAHQGSGLSASAMAALTERGVAATRQLAKRQLTWLRSMPQRIAVTADASDAVAQLLTAVDKALATA
jgi:tRNA dimethylallyltransferase